MKKIFTLFALLFTTLTAMAQMNGPMNFVGDGTFSGTFFGVTVTQDTKSDTIVFKMNSMTDGDISHPSLTFDEMGTTIPAFTVHGATFTFDMATKNATFPEQEFKETLTIISEDGTTSEKEITGTINAAQYTMEDKSFALDITFRYGNMPAAITYKITAIYVKPEGDTGLNLIDAESADAEAYDLMGNKDDSVEVGKIYVKGGKKVMIK